jgi:TrmH family RNA methyltransferase
MITSLQNEKVKLARMLQGSARARRKAGQIVLEGVRLVRDAVQAGQRPEFALYTLNLRDEGLLKALVSVGIEPLPVSEAVMRHISDTQQPQGTLAVFPLPRPALPPHPQHVLILDSIRDPGNLGTILRTAAAAGVDLVLLSPACVDAYNPKALRGGMGAHFRVPVVEMNWDEIGRVGAGLHIYMADSSGQTRYDSVDWSGRWGVIIGGEAHGAGDEARQLAQVTINIPMTGDTESLNAAVAAGVILFEARRSQR